MKDEQKCEWCDGTGAVDSGGFTPWGAGIDVACPECGGTGKTTKPTQPAPDRTGKE